MLIHVEVDLLVVADTYVLVDQRLGEGFSVPWL